MAVKLEVLALDFDGTIADHNVVAPANRAAIRRARARGIVVLIVTGRILEDLRRVAGDLRFVDAVVAENGAVVAFPENGRSEVLGTPPPDGFIDELRRRGIPTDRGECVVETDASYAAAILDVVRTMELPLTLQFNGGRVMILPPGISKATGLREALTAMRLSEHNALAIGDAENDHSLLSACEIGAAVSWGSRALKAIADDVVEGSGPDAVADYIDRVISQPKLDLPRNPRRRLTVGTTDTGQPVCLGVMGRNVLVVGDPRSGKSWIAGLLAEQLILQRYCVCVVDPEGDYRTLESLPGVAVVGGDDPPPRPREVALALRHPDVGLVIDLSKLKHGEKEEYIHALLPHLAALRRRTGLPHRIVVDEAHYFLGDSAGPRLADVDLEGYTLVTYRVSQLHAQVRQAADVVSATRVTDPAEIATLPALVDPSLANRDWRETLGELDLGEAMILRGADSPDALGCRFLLAPRFTLHVRHRQKYVNVQLMDREAFTFTCDGQPTGERALSLGQFVELVDRCPDQILDGHLRRGDFSRWIADVFADYPLAAQIRQIEHQYRLRRMLDPRDAIAQAVAERYAIGEGAAETRP
jgi:hydroxymethylpyrimidine pyrophosphatase-like HAD family hydrolase